jgi:hypothetical protein
MRPKSHLVLNALYKAALGLLTVFAIYFLFCTKSFGKDNMPVPQDMALIRDYGCTNVPVVEPDRETRVHLFVYAHYVNSRDDWKRIYGIYPPKERKTARKHCNQWLSHIENLIARRR